ncbi:MAG: DUF4339 domain-containing protein [Planctomycetes bacterium]|nr:DUF4339 domain-containing protein [Planctomycetota bacterium]MBM4056743.1 DUF4339 domain-containing protein [Planctomycetota bacterium]
MADDWFYTQAEERHGPVTWDRLRKLARDGWLQPTATVWQPGSPPRPAAAIDGLFPLSVGSMLQQAIGQLVPPPAASLAPPPPLPPDPASRSGRRRRRRRRRHERVEETLPFGWQPRHVVVAAGSLLAALGIAFLFIDPTPLALVFLLGGLVLMAGGLVVELRRVLCGGKRLRTGPPPGDRGARPGGRRPHGR